MVEVPARSPRTTTNLRPDAGRPVRDQAGARHRRQRLLHPAARRGPRPGHPSKLPDADPAQPPAPPRRRDRGRPGWFASPGSAARPGRLRPSRGPRSSRDLPHPLADYFEQGKVRGLAAGYLASRRTPWYAQERREPAPFLCTYMARARANSPPFRFFWNRSKATAPNVFLLLYPRPPLKSLLEARPELVPILFDRLKAIPARHLIGEGRVYGGGLHKIEPRELAALPAGEMALEIDGFRNLIPTVGVGARPAVVTQERQGGACTPTGDRRNRVRWLLPPIFRILYDVDGPVCFTMTPLRGMRPGCSSIARSNLDQSTRFTGDNPNELTTCHDGAVAPSSAPWRPGRRSSRPGGCSPRNSRPPRRGPRGRSTPTTCRSTRITT